MPPSPQNLLSAWAALEVLSPQTFKRPAELAEKYNGQLLPLDGPTLPWEDRISPPDGYRFYYHIVLGTITYQPAVYALLDVYGDERPERPNLPGETILAAVLLDEQGRLAGSSPVVISSFGWGFPVALHGDLRRLVDWSSLESKFTEDLVRLLQPANEPAQPQSVNKTGLQSARSYLRNVLGLPSAVITNNAFAIRVRVSRRIAATPDPLLLNSFFLGDLAWARKLFAEGKAPINLQRYMGLLAPGPRKDLLKDTTALDNLLAPSRFSPARWPGPGRHPLVLLQQAAVNAALQASPEQGVLAVNGPPGTGKTTLLRDVIAGVVTQRAEAMCAFKNPREAFKDSGEQVAVGAYYLRLFSLDKRLKGHELLVASSNNKAVENVSAELPGLGAIADDATDLRYFTCLSNQLLKRDTWGLIAAVLGNASNKYTFSQTFWWDKEVGFATYLSEILGTPQWIEEKDPVTKEVIGRHKPRIVSENLDSTGTMDALGRWQTAKERFQTALNESRAQLARLEAIRDQIAQLPVRQQEVATAGAKLSKQWQRHADAESTLSSEQRYLERFTREFEILDVELHAHKLQRPGFFARLFRTRSFRNWLARHHECTQKWLSARRLQLEQGEVVKEHTQSLKESETLVRNAEGRLVSANKNLQTLEQSLVRARADLPDTLLEPAFYQQGHKALHQSIPWCNKAIHRLRDTVFTRAIELHKAFIDAAAQPLKHNLAAMMYVFSRGTLPDDATMALLGDLWSSLFLVVPVLSTTFASVERLLGKLPPASLGWLLVDEAGQALPQAAVGAILRTQRAIVVGDPLQIEPVVTLPKLLTHTICQQFEVDPLRYNAPQASVQTLADAASPYYAEIESIHGLRTVGIPLLVHRRCAEPMFSVSNHIAYAGLMVSTKAPGPSSIRDVLGTSSWMHVQGTGTDKWCPEEGAVVLQILSDLKTAKIQPNLYIVTPFTMVADNLRRLIWDSRILEGWVEKPDSWPYERVGTVHTVQGRQAEAVIFVLGAPAEGQNGARQWAGNPPNLLNVAVSRAEEVIYVVGNRQLWKGAGVFRQLVEYIP